MPALRLSAFQGKCELAGLKRGNDGFGFGVSLQGFVAHLAVSAGLLVAAEGQHRVKHKMPYGPSVWQLPTTLLSLPSEGVLERRL